MSTFVHESEEDILQLNNALLNLENDPDSAEAIETVFRVAHNLKGNFGVMGFPTASELAHAVEDLLDGIRDGRLSVTADRMDLVFEAVDQLEAMVDEIADHGETKTDPDATVEAIRSSMESEDDQGADTTGENGDPDDTPDLPIDDLANVIDDLTDAIDVEDDRDVYRIDVEIGDTQTKRIDAMFLLDGIDDAFDMIRAVPPRDEVEAGDFESSFDVYVTSDEQTADRNLESFFDGNRYAESAAIERVTEAVVRAIEVSNAESETSEPIESDPGGSVGSDQGGPVELGPDGTEGDGSAGATMASRSKEIESIRVDVEQIDQLYNQVEEMVTSRIKLRKIIEGSGLVTAEEELEEHGKITSSLQDTVLEIRLVPLRKIVGNFPRVVRDLARDQDKEIDFRMEGVDIEMDRSILNELGDPLMHVIRNAVDHGIESPEEREDAGKPRTGTITLTGERERDRVSVTVEDDGAGLDVEAIREKAVENGIMSREEIELIDESEVYDLIFHPGFSTRDEVTEVSGRGVGMDVVNQVVRGVDGTINVESEPGEGTSVTLTLPVSVAIVRVLFVTANGEMYGVPIKNIDEISELEDVNVQSVEGNSIVTHDDRVYPLISLGEALDVPAYEPGEDDMVVRIKEAVRQVCIRCSDVVGQEEVVIKPFEGVLSGTPGISGASVLGEGEVVMILDVETL